MTPDQARAYKHFYFVSLLTQAMISQGEAMIEQIDQIMAELREAVAS